MLLVLQHRKKRKAAAVGRELARVHLPLTNGLNPEPPVFSHLCCWGGLGSGPCYRLSSTPAAAVHLARKAGLRQDLLLAFLVGGALGGRGGPLHIKEACTPEGHGLTADQDVNKQQSKATGATEIDIHRVRERERERESESEDAAPESLVTKACLAGDAEVAVLWDAIKGHCNRQRSILGLGVEHGRPLCHP